MFSPIKGTIHIKKNLLDVRLPLCNVPGAGAELGAALKEGSHAVGLLQADGLLQRPHSLVITDLDRY